MSKVRFDKFNTKKQKLLKSLVECKGIVSEACEKINMHRGTYYNYYNADPLFKSEVDKIMDICLDYVEGQLLKLIQGFTAGGKVVPPDTTAIIFYLKCKGKKRGYVERTEVGIIPPAGSLEIKVGYGKPADETNNEQS